MAKIIKFPRKKQPAPPEPPNATNRKKLVEYGGKGDGIFFACYGCGAGLDSYYELPDGSFECPLCGELHRF